MALSPGTRVGPYEVTAQIGAGGMGEVYRATDTKLKRQVALKVLPPSFAADRDRLARFQREAEVLASLNHPHIAAIYGFEEGPTRVGPYDSSDARDDSPGVGPGFSRTVHALVMELVEGEDLAQRIAHGALAIDEALPIAKQIAEALEAAHEQGIIHRDLKPANIKVRPDGTVKVLDFGLAKAIEGADSRRVRLQPDLSQSPTITTPAMTQAGMILGTAAYMSPEQAKGRVVDKRSDVWAFGAVLYEMLTGTRAFSGEDTTDVIAAVMKDTPNWSALPADVPAPIVTLIQRCLEKDRKTRIGDIAVARFLLTESASLARPASAAPAANPSRSHLSALAWALAGVFLISTAGVSLLHFRETPPLARSISFQIVPPESNTINQFRVSPDGRRLVFMAWNGTQNRLWLRSLDSVNAVPLAGTDGATYPFWSPDSTQIGFFAQGKLKKIPAAGGVAVNLADAVSGRGGTWNRDGVILFAADIGGGLYRVADTGGPRVAVTSVGQDDGGDRFPEFLPDGQRFLYLHATNTDPGLFGGVLSGGPFARILPEITNGMFVSGADPKSRDGFLIFRRDNTLMAQPFDPDRMQTTGGVVPIAEQVSIGGNTGYGAFAASPDGTIAYRSGIQGNVGQLAWLDRSGKRLAVVSKPDEIETSALSPDGNVVAFGVGNRTAGVADIWLQNLESGVRSKFTFGQGAKSSPIWSPDGQRIAFTFWSLRNYSIQEMAASGAGRPDVLLEGPALNTVNVTDWSRDGKLIVFTSRSEKTRDDLFLLTMDDHKASAFLQTPAVEEQGRFSPDSQWLAYMSNESGGPEIYVQHVPPNGLKYQISSAGGVGPQWSRDGKELFYLQAPHTLMSVPVKTGGTFERGQARQLFDSVPLEVPFQPSADGQRFLVVQPDEKNSQQAPITVVTNWPATLKK